VTEQSEQLMGEGADPDVAALAEEVRQLRANAGEPGLRTIASSTGVAGGPAVSKSAVADLLKGRHLPTWSTVSAVANALGADSARILRLRELWDKAARVRTSGALDRGELAESRYVKLTCLITEDAFDYLRRRQLEKGFSVTDSVGRALNLAMIIDDSIAKGARPQLALDGVVRPLVLTE
jgi:Helix-turn-helix domain